jgi:hypothetical protein
MTAHIMLDIETLGTRPGAVVMSAAFVRFSDMASVTLNLNVQEQLALGLEIDPQTHAWWGTQDPAAWAAATQNAHPVRPVLEYFGTWLQWASAGAELMLWCHGASFDAPVLGEVYRRLGLATPWSFRAIRDTRTLYDLAAVDPKQYQAGALHVALNDAIGQTNAAKAALAVLARAHAAPAPVPHPTVPVAA